MSGFASGLQAGLAMSNQWMDTYERAKQRNLFAAQKQRADLGEYQRYSQADADKLQEYASATNEQGQPMYRLSIDPGSTQYRVQQIMYPDIPQQSSSLDFVVPDRAPAGLAPQPTPSSDAQSYGVPTDVLPEERVLTPGSASSAPLYAEFGQGSAPVRPDLGYAMTPRGVGLEAAAPQGQPPFDVPEANYTSTLDAERLQDSRAYQGLTREYGPETSFAPSRSVYMGREYDPGALTESEKRSRLQEAYADVYEQMGKPEEAMRLRSMAAQERRAAADEARKAELFPIQKEAAQLQLDEAKFGMEDRKKVRELDQFMAANPTAPTKDILAKAAELQIGPKATAEAIKQLTGVTTADMDRAKTEITTLIKDMSFDDMLAEHKNNNLISPGSHYEAVRDDKGNVALYMVDTATGKRLTASPDFAGTMQEADKYLRTAAVDKSSLLDYTINLRKTKAEIESKEAAAQESRDKGAYYRAGGRSAGGTGFDSRTYNALSADVARLNREASDALAILNDRTVTDQKQKAAAKERYNYASREVERLRGIMAGMTGDGAGGGSGGGEYVKGREYIWPGADGKDEAWVYTGDPSQGRNGFVRKEDAAGAPKQERKEVASPTIKPRQGTAQPAAKTIDEQISELENRLVTDDRIKEGGFGGIGGRAIRERAFPMGIGERRDVERRLEELKKQRAK